MATVALDTVRYVTRLQAAGVSREQAEAQAEALYEAVSDTLATKADIVELRAELRAEIRDAKYDLLKWFIGISVAQTVTTILALLRLSSPG